MTTSNRVAIATAIALIVPRIPAAADYPLGVTAEVLVKSESSWNGTPYKAYPSTPPQLTVLRMTIPAHTTLPWHVHPMPNATYVLSGHITVEDRATGRKRVVKAGEAFNEQTGAEHRGVTDNEPCVVVITYAGTPGMPTSVTSSDQKSKD